MGLDAGPRPQASQAPQCAFLSHQLDPRGPCPESCAALQRLVLVPGLLCAIPVQEQWAVGWFYEQISENRSEAVS